MYQRILVAVDGSQTSDLALQEAIQLAKALGSQMRLIHAVDVVGSSWYTPDYTDPAPLWEFIRKNGEEILEQASTTVSTAGIQVDSHLEEINSVGRRTADVIIEQAKAWPADLIVLGTHGRRGLSKIVLGSVAEGVMRQAGKPVLLIHGE